MPVQNAIAERIDLAHGTPRLGGCWGTVGGNIFFSKHLGFGVWLQIASAKWAF